MRFLADECFDARLARFLSAAGHDVAVVARDARSANDETVLARAEAESRILLTEDKDFGELAIRQRRAAAGIVLLRMDGATLEVKQQRLALLMNAVDRLSGHFTVVDAKRFRFRPLPRAGA